MYQVTRAAVNAVALCPLYFLPPSLCILSLPNLRIVTPAAGCLFLASCAVVSGGVYTPRGGETLSE